MGEKCSTEATFAETNNEDAMATDKLGRAIRAFAADQVKLDELV